MKKPNSVASKKVNRRSFITRTSLFAAGVYLMPLHSYGRQTETDVTFFVVGDTHFDPPPETDQYYHVVAMNKLGKQDRVWPETINGKPTGFEGKGQTIQPAAGVVLVGDITDKADPTALALLKNRYEMGPAPKQIHYPIYVGLGNHDLDPDGPEDDPEFHRKMMWSYVEERHKGAQAPVPVTHFDPVSRNYSWDWGKLHLVQCQRYAGETDKGQTNSLPWLRSDLEKYASDGRPVVLFQHYGFDKWALGWWTEEERQALKTILDDYNVISIFAGHAHVAMNLEWQGYPILQVNNAWPEIGKGNNDGNGSFLMVRISDSFMDAVTCRWVNDKGDTEFVEPFFTKRLE